jgi:pilus assembly protein CpaB
MSYPGSFGKKNYRLLPSTERERLLFIAAAGLAFSLIVIFAVVVSYRLDADARESATVSLHSSSLATLSLLVSERPIRAGEKLSDLPLKEVPWPISQAPDGALRDKSEVKDHFARMDIPQGVPLQREFLSKDAVRGSLPITTGFRAVTIEVDATTGLEGLALPGTRVDVLLTTEPSGQGGEVTTKAIVQNARVLASGGDTTSVQDRSGPNELVNKRDGKSTVTLEVSPDDAMRVANSRQVGRLSLMMRALEDTQILPDVVFDSSTPSSSKEKYQDTHQDCARGRAKINGKEYVIHCDGSKTEVEDIREP